MAMMAAMRTSGKIMDKPTENIHSNKSTIHRKIGEEYHAVRNKDFVKQLEKEKKYETENRKLAEWTLKHKVKENDERIQRDIEEEAKRELLKAREHENRTGYRDGKAIEPTRLVDDPNSRSGKILTKPKRFDFFKYSNARHDTHGETVGFDRLHMGTPKSLDLEKITESKIKQNEETLNRESIKRDLLDLHKNHNGRIPIKDPITGEIIQVRPQDTKLIKGTDGRGLFIEGIAYGTEDERNGYPLKNKDGVELVNHKIYKKVGTTIDGQSLAKHTKIIHGDKYEPAHSLNQGESLTMSDEQHERHHQKPEKFTWSHGKKVYGYIPKSERKPKNYHWSHGKKVFHD
jgi:hypothetical protein